MPGIIYQDGGLTVNEPDENKTLEISQTFEMNGNTVTVDIKLDKELMAQIISYYK